MADETVNVTMEAEAKRATIGTETKEVSEGDYIGSAIDEEDVYPDGLRNRAGGLDRLLGRRLAYNELGDDQPDPGDDEWMLDASSFSGGGARGSKNFMGMLLFVLMLAAIVVCMHTWWDEIKISVSRPRETGGDGRRLEEGWGPGLGSVVGKSAVYHTNLES